MFERRIDREELARKIESKEGFVLAEVLGPAYYARGHLQGAILMPPDRVAEVARAAIPDRSTPVVLYCASDTCQNSHVAARALTELGYEDVRVYAGGKADWMEAGLPLVVTEAA